MRPAALARLLGVAFVCLTSATGQAQELPLSAEQVRRLEIGLAKVQLADIVPLAVLAGIVVPPPNTRLAASAPFAGTVIQVQALPGQPVKKGAVIATISSRDLLEVQSQLSQSEAELQMAEATARRRRALVDKDFQNPAMAEEAEAQVAKIKAVIEQHRRMTALNGIRIEKSGTYGMPAPADGIVADVKAVAGETVDAMDALLTIDTSRARWVEIQAPASLVATVEPGDAVQVGSRCVGRVTAVGRSLDRLTRSAKLYASFPDHCDLLIGQLVSVTLQQPAITGAMSIPASAVARLSGKTAVFLRSRDGFTVAPIELKGQSASAATIVGAFPPGSEVAANGLPQLEQTLTSE